MAPLPARPFLGSLPHSRCLSGGSDRRLFCPHCHSAGTASPLYMALLNSLPLLGQVAPGWCSSQAVGASLPPPACPATCCKGPGRAGASFLPPLLCFATSPPSARRRHPCEIGGPSTAPWARLAGERAGSPSDPKPPGHRCSAADIRGRGAASPVLGRGGRGTRLWPEASCPRAPLSPLARASLRRPTQAVGRGERRGRPDTRRTSCSCAASSLLCRAVLAGHVEEATWETGSPSGPVDLDKPGRETLLPPPSTAWGP
ncbi:UNVERIFIED_CONTAM: hypothetical protein K2H54_017376 [Gekko kuhli]